MNSRRLRGRLLRNPVRAVPLAFLAAIATGTAVLMLPAAREGPYQADPLTALFTATSAVCVTGLIVEDTPTYWSPLGQAVIMILFQVGGFGIMTMATLLTVLVVRRLGLSDRLLAQVETKHGLGDLRGVVLRIAATVVVCESILALILTVRLRTGYGYPWDKALWHGGFQAVSAFNNAGFSTFSTSLMDFATDWIINLPIMVAIIIGGMGSRCCSSCCAAPAHRVPGPSTPASPSSAAPHCCLPDCSARSRWSGATRAPSARTACPTSC